MGHHSQPNMVFNARTHRDYLHSVTSYVAGPTFLPAFGWGQDGSANVLVNKQTNELATVIIVGKVVHDRVYCGPSGTWATGNRWGSLKEAKYQLTLYRPDEEIFANEFDAAFRNLGKVQSSIAVTQDRKNLLIGENEKINNVRFSASVFEQRERVSDLLCFYCFNLFKPLPAPPPSGWAPPLSQPSTCPIGGFSRDHVPLRYYDYSTS